jgi:hypothetical protein
MSVRISYHADHNFLLIFIPWKEKSTELTVESGHILCPDCDTRVNVGNVGIQNYYKCHKGSAQCMTNKKCKKVKDTVEKTKQNAFKFFQPQVPGIPSAVTAPALINPQQRPTVSSTLVSHQDKTVDHTPPDAVVPITGCPIGHKLLH